MKPINRVLLFVLLSITFIILNKCTENPFFEDDQISGKRIIRGKVELSDQSSPNDVFVWLDELNTSTRTDKDGIFQLTLPSPAKQTGGGLNSIFTLYFYVANYALDSAQVVIHNGYLEYSNGDLNAKGELKETKCLNKLLNITFTVCPVSVSVDHSDTMFVFLSLQAVHGSVEVVIPKMNLDIPKGRPDLLSAVMIRAIDTEENYVKLIHTGGNIQRTYTVAETPLQWLLIFEKKAGMIPVGRYQFVPYLFIQQKIIPPGLMKSLGENIEDFNPSYLNIPLKVQDGEFEIIIANTTI